MDGILNVNKPAGITSFDVVAKIRRLTGTKKVGHAGTLDPMASGVLPVCAGKATKIIEFLMEKDKSYRVGLVLGRATDTQDATGTTVYEKPVTASDEEIERVIGGFVGEREQTPPMYSAVRVNGKRLYELARRGIEIERKPRNVTFYDIALLGIERRGHEVGVIMDVDCSKGTYMRTLCHDIGEKLGCGGHMSSLVRTRSGPFSIENSYTIDCLAALKENNRLESAFMDMDKALAHLPEVHVSHGEAIRLKNGCTVPFKIAPGLYRLYHENGYFLGIAAAFEQDHTTMLKARKWIGHESL